MFEDKRSPHLKTGWENRRGGLRILFLVLFGLYICQLFGLAYGRIVYGHPLTVVRFLVPTCIIGGLALLLYLGSVMNRRRGS